MNNKRLLVIILIHVISLFLIALFIYLNPFKIGCITDSNNNCPVEQEADLMETQWKLREINDVLVSSEVILSIVDEQVSISACNNINFGNIQIDKTKFYFDETSMTTLMACEGEIGDIEAKINSIFNKPLGYEIDLSMKTLRIGDENNTFVFSSLFEETYTALSFTKGTVTLFAEGNLPIESTQDGILLDETDEELSEENLVEKMYEIGIDNSYYIQGERDSYYMLYPNFHRTLSIVDNIEDLSYTKQTEDAIITSTCTNKPFLQFDKESTSQSCTTVSESRDEENGGILTDTIANCYLKLENNKYLAYIQYGSTMDSTYDLCEELLYGGLNSWTYSSK